jgi:glucosamine--fructose-6-phosphate aminotransferase (isomerizing)
MSRSFVIEGLSRLEYRGYDSAGYACLHEHDHQILHSRATGQLSRLVERLEEQPIDGHVGIGHTRWSTHGVVSEINAHPHFDCNRTLYIVHNGIIENHLELEKKLKALGHIFNSQTDSEMIAHVFEETLKTQTELLPAIVSTVAQLKGAYGLITILQKYPDVMVVIRKGSPLCIGVGKDEMFVASDLLAFAGKTKEVVFMPDETFAILKKNSIELFDFSGKSLPVIHQKIDVVWNDQEKGQFEHFMLKEIYEQKSVIHSTIYSLQERSHLIWDQLGLTPEQVKKLRSIHMIGCGTSWNAARIAQFFFESVCKIPVYVHLGSEVRYMPMFPEENSLYIAISQSGETADTLEPLRLVKQLNLPTVALTNVPSSTMVREADGFFLTQAGPEVAVASTKAFSTQLAALYWLAHRIAVEKGLLANNDMAKVCEDVIVAAEILESSIENYKYRIMSQDVPFYSQFSRFIFLGRHISYPFAMEAALKLKEITYSFAEAYPAGELKHGPLALIDESTPVFIVSVLDEVIYKKILSNAQEVKARNGHIVAFVFEGQDELADLADTVFTIPHVQPLLGTIAMTGLMQFFMYQMAKTLGCPIDKPRNLAKSVTVE